ncbi:Sec34-like family protein [Coniochaeta ligniaria NRRL 30616]|uniref:Conserved oligomeric Golgi complex subunit 3 n=1 Tax=Coniochaeta ligniaria NRRL 30616 TaxID=1408157 RepID=A0A1J7IGB5_9PEZI|nr:Sec34-like family protein [Coniochaeta ligniaria NRRL 30616]
MYEDSWYSFVPEVQQHKRGASQNLGRRRAESLLQQPNETANGADAPQPLEDLFEDPFESNSPPEPTLARRAKSYSDFYDIVKAQLHKDGAQKKRKKTRRNKRREICGIEALDVPETDPAALTPEQPLLDLYKDELLQASQQKYQLYHDQLAMTERHLDALLDDTDSALKLLASLSESFDAVEEQTTSFKSQCDDLITEQTRLEKLADEVGTDLHYYAYLDNVTRRLNAPGAGRLVDDDAFGEVLENLDSCIAFMMKNSSYRDAEQYLARYQSLMTKALHLLEVGFESRLEKVSAEISPKIAATQSESARHALAYGRFEELISESYCLLPNIRKVVLNAYDQAGNARLGPNFDVYSNTVNSIFQAYLNARDRFLRTTIQHDFDTFKSEVKAGSIESAARNLIKQCFERAYGEETLFTKIFSVEPQYNSDAHSVYAVLKSNTRPAVNPVNIVPLATNLQSALQSAPLQTICNVVGWATNEYLLLEYDEEETGFVRHCRELAARLLTEHLWAFTDRAFEAEIDKSIVRATVGPEALTIGPVTNGVASSNAYPPIRRALELLVMFDQCMPKERSQRTTSPIPPLLHASLSSLRLATSRIRAARNGTDPDLFAIKNLLILKNELVSLEIVPSSSSQPAVAAAAATPEGMQHFSQIWDSTLSISSSVQAGLGFLAGLGSYIPRPFSHSPATSKNGLGEGGGEEKNPAEQLDDLLRQSIYAFTSRWGGLIHDAKTRKTGAKTLAKVERELEDVLDRAFAGQHEVVGKLKEAVWGAAEAVGREGREEGRRKGSKGGR